MFALTRGRPLAVALAVLTVVVLGMVGVPRQSAADAALVVWTIGDSITFGASAGHPVPGGYRTPLARALLARDVQVHYVGTTATNSSPALAGFGQRHDGHSGWATSDVLAHLSSWSVPTPDVIVVHLGTNDLRHGRVAPAIAAARLDWLLRTLTDRFPTSTVVVAAIVPSGRAGRCDGPTREYDGLVRGLVRERSLGTDRVVLAEVWGAFISGACSTRRGLLSRDNLHPSAQGYVVMGNVLADVLAPLAESRRSLTP